MSRNSSKSVPYFLLRLFLSIFVISFVGITVWHFLPGRFGQECANSISCAKDLTVKVENNTEGFFDGQKILPPQIDLNAKATDVVLGASVTPGEKHIYVDLSTQKLYAYQGKTLVFQTLVATGKWNKTPTGDFSIWIKLRSTRMTGGEGDDAYDLPNVPYVMFFYNDDVPKSLGFSLHGAYWHNNFGHAMSHGCVNMRIVDAQTLYNWVDPPTDGLTTYASDEHPGTKITIKGNAPGV